MEQAALSLLPSSFLKSEKEQETDDWESESIVSRDSVSMEMLPFRLRESSNTELVTFILSMLFLPSYQREMVLQNLAMYQSDFLGDLLHDQIFWPTAHCQHGLKKNVNKFVCNYRHYAPLILQAEQTRNEQWGWSIQLPTEVKLDEKFVHQAFKLLYITNRNDPWIRFDERI